MTTHRVDAERATVHGQFDRELPPILSVQSGDTVIYRTLDAGWGLGRDRGGDRARGFERDPERDTGHALNGPIFIEGATPGDALEIEIGEITPGPWGRTWAGPRPWMDRWQLGIEKEVRVEWQLHADDAVASNLHGMGVTVPVRPFMGVMGNAPSESGPHETGPPRRVGGNIDCRELVSGSTLWLPVEVEGALFSVGDGHAAQGDGELSSTAIECAMDRVELRFTVRKDMTLVAPRAMTPAGYLTFGMGFTLDDAAELAANEMLDHLQGQYGLDRSEALVLASVAADLRVTQVVNGTVGCHVLLRRDAFTIRSRDAQTG